MSSFFLFNQLRSRIWSSCPSRLLMQHAGSAYTKLIDPRSYQKLHFTKKVEEMVSLHRTGLVSSISGVQPLKFQQTSEHQQPATVHELSGTVQHAGFSSRKLLSGTVLIFDTETTGLSYKYNRIIELAVCDLSGGNNSKFESLINPESDVPKAVSDVNNIRTDLVRRPDVPRFSDVLPSLLAYVQSRQTPGEPVIWVAHNAKFDARFLAQEFGRCSAQMPEDWLFVDSLRLARKLPKLPKTDENKHKLNLESLSKRYGISVEKPAHRAMQDVETLCQVFQKISSDLELTYEGLLNEATKASDFK